MPIGITQLIYFHHNIMESKYKGKHIFFDFENFDIQNETVEEAGNDIFSFMIQAITEKTDMKIVHKHLEILKQPITEDGFTSVLLLDASHFTAHSYTGKDKKLLAMDLFTCGNTDTEKVVDFIFHKIIEKYPMVKNSKYTIEKRFKYC